jgi:hypothetical protein
VPTTITADDVLSYSPQGAQQPSANGAPRVITAQDVLDFVPRDPALQPQIVDTQGRDINPLDFEYANSPQDLPKVGGVEQRPTGADTNVLPGNAGFGANFKSAFVEDPRTKIGMYAKALFPNDPNAAQRFGVRDGKIAYIDDEGNIRDVEHGFGSRSGNALGYAPETAGTILGSFATANPVSGSAIGAVGGKAVKQMIGGLVFDDPQTTSGNLKGMLGEGTIALLSGGAAKGAGKFFNKGRVVDFTPAQLAEAQALAQQIEQRLGIKLDLSQASGDPMLMALRKYAAKDPGQASQIYKQLDVTQTGQTASAMQALLEKVAKETSSEAAGTKGINAAAKAIKDARGAVSAEVKPLYDAAYKAVPEVTDEKIVKMLELGPFKKAMASAKELAELEGIDTSKNSLQLMDYVKRALDDQIAAAKQGGQREMARALTLKRNEFVKELDAIPNQEWQAARKRYGELAESKIRPLEEGAVGVLANTENRKAATVAAKMFTDPNITASEIAFARGAIEKADPEAWRALTRQYLATNLNKALKVTQKGETVNLAGKLYQSMAGTPETLAKLRKALPSDAQEHLNDVLGAFKMIAATERAGSDTAFNQLVTKKLEGRFATTLKTLRQPVQTAIEAKEQSDLDRIVRNLADGLTDPAKVRQLRQVSKASPSLQRAIQIASILTVSPSGRYLEGEVNPLPDTPEPQLEPLRGASRRLPTRGSP